MTNRGIAGAVALVLWITLAGVLVAAPHAAATAQSTASSAPAPLVSSTLASPQAADLGWTSPTVLVPQTPLNANLGSVALAGDRTGVIVYEQDGITNLIMATRFIPGGGGYGGSDWQSPVNLSSPGCNAFEPVVAMNATGYAMALWGDSCYYGIAASLYTPGVGWHNLGYIDQPYWSSWSPRIAMNAAGVTFATWEAWSGSAYYVFANRYVPGTGWGSAVRIDTSTNTTGGANIAVDAAGNATLTYYRYDAPYHVYAARFEAATSSWSAPLALETSLNTAYYPDVSMDSQGNAIIAWIQSDPAADIWATRYDAVSGWSTAVNIESQPAYALGETPQVAANNGSAVVAWVMYGPGSEPYSVFANHYTAGVGWGTESDVDGAYSTTVYGDTPSVSLDASGNATIVYHYVQIQGTYPYPTWMYDVRYSALTGGVLGYLWVDGPRVGEGNPIVAMDPNGNVLATWNFNENTAANPINGILANYYRPGSGWFPYGPQQASWDQNVYPWWEQLESNAAGDAIYSWTQWNGLVWDGYASIYTPTGGWGPATKIENFNRSGVTEEWSAIDGQGNALVFFRASDGTQYNVYAAYYSVRSGWHAPVRLDNAVGSGKDWLRVAMNAEGEGVAIWDEWNGVQWNAYSAFFNGTTQTWSSPIVVQSQYDSVGSVVVGLDGSGNAMAALQAYNGSGYSDYAAYYTPASGWAPLVHLVHSSLYAGVPYALAMNDQGDFAASWSEWDGSRYSAVATVFTPQSGWAPETYLSHGPSGSSPAIPSLDPAGDAMVTYQMWDGVQTDVYAVTRPAGGSWGTAVRLNSADAFGITQVLDHSGNGFAAWTQYNGYGYDIVARRYVAGQGWLPSVVVNTPAPATAATDTGTALLGVDGHGDAMLGFIEWHQNVLVPYAAEYIVGTGAPNLALTSPSDHAVTNNPSVSVSGTTDPGATVTINGTSVPVSADGAFGSSFTLADGTYTFTVVATDQAGFTTTATRTVTIDTTAPALRLTSPSSGLLTRDPVVEVTGSTEAGTTVVVNGVDAAVSPSGSFSVAIALQEGSNTITATATDAAGNQAQATVGVTLDTTPPALAITSPTAGANVTVPTVTVTGTAEPGATLVVDGKPVAVDSTGAFSVQVPLSEGANLITATATDAAGNSESTMVVVTYTNPLPAAQVQSTLGSLNLMDLVLIVLVVVSLGLGLFEMVQIRKLKASQGSASPPAKPETPKPPEDDL